MCLCNLIVPLGTVLSLGFENSATTGFAGLPIHKTRGEMRRAQRFGYDEVGASSYGVSAPPGFWAFLIFGEGLQPSGYLNLCSGDYTMTDKNTAVLVKSLVYAERPLHVFLYNERIAFLTREVGAILDIPEPTGSMNRSRTLETDFDYDIIPAASFPDREGLNLAGVNHVSILYLSGFFSFVIRSRVSLVMPFIRWAILEIPLTYPSECFSDLIRGTRRLLRLSIEQSQGMDQNMLLASQLLIDQGYLDADPEAG